MTNHFPSHLSDGDLVAEIERLAAFERDATARLVAHLAELDARRLYLGAGYPSLFAYCTERLRISEYGAYNRMEAARAARRFPVILGMLSDGSMTLTTVRILAPHLTDENHCELLESACRRSKREVEELVARHFPRPAVAALVRRLPVRGGPAIPASVQAISASPPPNAAFAAVAAEQAFTGVDQIAERVPPRAQASPAMTGCVPPSARPTVTPLSPERYQVRFTASAETHRKLGRAQELLGHALPSGDIAMVFDRALTALIAELTRKKIAATDRTRPARRGAEGSRHIPSEIRRNVWRRDDGQCAFVAPGGVRCSARKPLEFHHVHPYGAGGPATVGNIELRCRSHNAYEAELFYGGTPNGRKDERTRPGASSAPAQGEGTARA